MDQEAVAVTVTCLTSAFDGSDTLPGASMWCNGHGFRCTFVKRTAQRSYWDGCFD